MDCKAITILKFFELIEKDGDQTQRSIAKNLDISLGNANAIVNGLVDSGHIRVRENPKSRIQYIMTSKGDSEKVRLAYEYLNFSLTFYCDIKARLKRTFHKLCRQKIRSVIFYGAGEPAKIAFQLLQQTPIELRGVIDANLAGQMFFGKAVLRPDKLSSMSYDKIFITELVDGKTIEHIREELIIPRDDLITVVG